MRLLTTLLFLAAGCVGSIGDENGGGDGDGDGDGNPQPTRTAREMFKSDVHPALAKCQSDACHNITAQSPALSKFYSPNADTAYDAVVITSTLIGSPSFSELAPILQFIKAAHKGLSYTVDEETKMKAWLAKETEERAAGGGSNQPPPFDAKAALKEWSGCMSLENFNAAGMTNAWATLGADNLQKCLNCHNGGVAGFYISANAQNFFNAISTQAAYLVKYFGINAAERTIVVNTGSFQSANMIQGHPTFPIETNAGMIALKKFYESTLARKTANLCDPPRLVD
jgi:hypothetical protein